MAARSIKAKDWMHWFIGASELDLVEDPEAYYAHKTNCKPAAIKSQDGQREWQAGDFQFPTVAELRKLVDQLPPVETAGACELTVVDGIDIGRLQGELQTADKAMVQVASNFHCLENASIDISADYGHLVEGYATDSTQGPASAFGVPAASILRAHFPFASAEKSASTWGQSQDNEVKLLSEVEEFCGITRNGKLLLTGREQPVTEKNIERVVSSIRVGIHSDCQVVFRRASKANRLEVVPQPFPMVDQVLSASANWWDLGHIPVERDLRNMTRALLRAAYDGAYLAAILRRRKLLLLTMIGGASFGNPASMIYEEIVAAHHRWCSHPASELREVRLCMFERGAAGEAKAIIDTLRAPRGKRTRVNDVEASNSVSSIQRNSKKNRLERKR